MTRNARRTLVVMSCFVATGPSFCGRSEAADLVFVQSVGKPGATRRPLEVATTFYGVNLRAVAAKNAAELRDLLARESTIGVAIDAEALPKVDRSLVMRALKRRAKGSVPVLIAGVTPETSRAIVAEWSGGKAFECRRMSASAAGDEYVIEDVEGVTRELGGFVVPLSNVDFYFDRNASETATEIAGVRNGQVFRPAFVETQTDDVSVFLDCSGPFRNDPLTKMDMDGIAGAFSRIAPVMMYIRYCAGERAWHAPHPYANLTIDDPWLREPYGNFSYEGLLREMEKHKFHTTVAFIPWNYDRSEAKVSELIRQSPERFSIAIHGNNHDHKEFTDFKSVSLAYQVAALKQSLARMDAFRALTGIPYDKVMVFPHSIGPQRTLVALREYNYLATVNSSNIPMDRAGGLPLSELLRSITVSYGGFPSLTRYSVEGEIPQSFLAMMAFLDNPLLFYGHEVYFHNGIGAFNAMAEQVNRMEPSVRWRSLGEIVRHSYLIKQRDESAYDVLTFTRDTTIENPSRGDASFYITKPESVPERIQSVCVDGHPYPFAAADGYLVLHVAIALGGARRVEVEYQNDLVLTEVSSSKTSIRVYGLRLASDFRDIVLSRSALGRVVRNVVEADLNLIIASGTVLVLLLCTATAWRITLVRRGRLRNTG